MVSATQARLLGKKIDGLIEPVLLPGPGSRLAEDWLLVVERCHGQVKDVDKTVRIEVAGGIVPTFAVRRTVCESYLGQVKYVDRSIMVQVGVPGQGAAGIVAGDVDSARCPKPGRTCWYGQDKSRGRVLPVPNSYVVGLGEDRLPGGAICRCDRDCSSNSPTGRVWGEAAGD